MSHHTYRVAHTDACEVIAVVTDILAVAATVTQMAVATQMEVATALLLMATPAEVATVEVTVEVLEVTKCLT